MTAEHVAHLVSERTGLLVGCKPVVVLADDDTRLVARLDDLAVLHRRRLGEWLARQPLQLDHATIARIRAAVGATA